MATDNKQRYSFNEDNSLIRANQGHSISVDVELKEQEPPEFLYHGTAARFLKSIEAEGLKPMSLNSSSLLSTKSFISIFCFVVLS